MCKNETWYKGCTDPSICQSLESCQQASIISTERSYREKGLHDTLLRQAKESTCMHPDAVAEREHV